MRSKLLASGLAILALVTYLVLSEVYYGEGDFLAAMFSPLLPQVPIMVVHVAFVGLAVTCGGLVPSSSKKPKRKTKAKTQIKPVGCYDIEVIIVGKGVNHHEHIKTDKLETTHNYNEKPYHIDPQHLYIDKTGMFSGFNNRLRGLKQRFCIVFEQDKLEALGPHLAKSETVSSGLLHVVERSTIFRKAFDELFARQLGGKKILFILILCIVGVFVYLMWTGQLDLRRLGFT